MKKPKLSKNGRNGAGAQGRPASKPPTLKAPSDLSVAGGALWADLTQHFAFGEGESCGLAELCRVADRLAQVRGQLAAEGLVVAGKRHPLMDVEPKLSGQFRMLLRALRLDVVALEANK